MQTNRKIHRFKNIRRIGAGLALVFAAGLVQIEARVYVQTDQALAEAFPGAQTERKAQYLSKAEQARLRQIADLETIGRFHTFYIARKNGRVQGYALFDTHIVRSKEETVFVALNADGSVRTARIVSFFEPQEYLAPERWLKIFQNKTADDDLRAGRDLPSISGATLTTRAVSTAVRKTLQLYRTHFGSR